MGKCPTLKLVECSPHSKKSVSPHWENIFQPLTEFLLLLLTCSLTPHSMNVTGLNIILFCSSLTLVNNAVIIRFPEYSFQNVSNNHIAPTCCTWVIAPIAQFT